MAKITIDGVTLEFSESAFTAAQWEQVASWVLNGGGNEAAESARIALQKALEAANSAASAKDDANSAKSYAVGGTGTREGEDADNAKYYCQQAKVISTSDAVFSVNGVQADDTGNVNVTTDSIGAFPIIDARSSAYDMDSILTGGVHFGVYRVGSTTGGTPYKAGITDRAYGLVISFASSANYGVQIAYLAGDYRPYFRYLYEGTIYGWVSFYTGWNIPTAGEIGAVALTGDAMEGDLAIEKSAPTLRLNYINPNSQGFFQNTGHSVWLGIKADKDDSQNYRYLTISDAENSGGTLLSAVRFSDKVDGTTRSYNLFGGHNKPSGSYTGNGSEASRTITTGGTGRMVLIQSTNGTALTTSNTTMTNNGATLSALGKSNAKFEDGVLTLTTTDLRLNANGVTYYYQVL